MKTNIAVIHHQKKETQLGSPALEVPQRAEAAEREVELRKQKKKEARQ